MSDLPSGWARATVGDVTLPITVVDPKLARDNTFTYVDIGSIDNTSNRIAEPKTLHGRDAPSRARQLLKAGDTVFSTVRTYLRNIGFVDASLSGAIGSTGFSVLRPAHGVHPRLLYYYALTNRFVDGLSAQMRGTSYPAVVDRQVRAMAISMPPTAEQQRIVGVVDEQFSRLDAGTAALDRVTAQLARFRRTALASATRGHLTSDWRTRQPALESAANILDRIQQRRGSRRRAHAGPQVKMPSLPAGWCWATTGALCDCIVPNRDKPKSFTGDIPWITLPDFGNEIEIDVARSGLGLTTAEVAASRAKLVPAGSVVMSCIGRFGLSAVLRQDAVINQQLHAFLVPPEMNSRYLAYAIQTQSQYMEGIATSTTIAYLNKANCNSIPIPLPPLEEQTEIVRLLDRYLSEHEKLSKLLIQVRQRASNLRSAILSAAFSGTLVRQDPSDEPASILIERIASERASSNNHRLIGGRQTRATRAKVTA